MAILSQCRNHTCFLVWSQFGKYIGRLLRWIEERQIANQHHIAFVLYAKSAYRGWIAFLIFLRFGKILVNAQLIIIHGLHILPAISHSVCWIYMNHAVFYFREGTFHGLLNLFSNAVCFLQLQVFIHSDLNIYIYFLTKQAGM